MFVIVVNINIFNVINCSSVVRGIFSVCNVCIMGCFCLKVSLIVLWIMKIFIVNDKNLKVVRFRWKLFVSWVILLLFCGCCISRLGWIVVRLGMLFGWLGSMISCDKCVWFKIVEICLIFLIVVFGVMLVDDIGFRFCNWLNVLGLV